jgi:hypothetical protein
MGTNTLRRPKILKVRANAAAAILVSLLLLGGCGFARIEGALVGDRPAQTYEGVKLTRGDSSKSVSRGMALQKDDILETDDRTAVVIRFEGGTEVLLEPQTKVRLGSLWTYFGSVIAKVKDAFAVDTEYGTAGTKSTLYVVRADPSGLFEVTVLEGQVDVSFKKDADEPARKVTAGQRLTRRRVEDEVSVSVRPFEGDSVRELEAATRRRFERATMSIVPDLGGKTDREARRLLSRAKLHCRIVYEYTGKHDPATVVRQDPEPGAPVKPNATVVLTVEKSARVPNVVGLEREQAKRRLESAGLFMSPQEFVEGARPGTIARQQVAAGENVAPGTKVGVEIAAIRLPDFQKQGPDDAAKRLKALGLKSEFSWKGTGERRIGIIVAQDPRPGTLVLPGETVVHLTVQLRVG